MTVAITPVESFANYYGTDKKQNYYFQGKKDTQYNFIMKKECTHG